MCHFGKSQSSERGSQVVAKGILAHLTTMKYSPWQAAWASGLFLPMHPLHHPSSPAHTHTHTHTHTQPSPRLAVRRERNQCPRQHQEHSSGAQLRITGAKPNRISGPLLRWWSWEPGKYPQPQNISHPLSMKGPQNKEAESWNRSCLWTSV